MANKKIVLISVGAIQIKIDPEVELELKNKGLFIGFLAAGQRESEYPWTFGGNNAPVEPLHLFVWRFFRADTRPLKKDEVLHHRDKNKSNACIDNLGPGTRSLHAKVHALDRQRFTFRKRDRLGGLFRPHAASEARTVDGEERTSFEHELYDRDRWEEEEKNDRERWAEASRWPSTIARPPPEDAESVLAAVFRRLAPNVAPLDSGQKIPPPPSRPRQADRLLHIGRIRRGCTPGEVGLVFALIDQGFDLDAVAADTKLPRTIIEKMLKEPAVSLAIENWHKYKRLPKPNSLSKLGTWATALKKRQQSR